MPVKTAVVTPVEECHQVAREVCTPVAEKVARQVCQEVAVAVAPVAVEHHVAPVVVQARAPAVAVATPAVAVAAPAVAVASPAVAVAHHGHGLTKVESTLHGAARHGAGANYEYGDAHSFVSRRQG